MSAAYNLVIVFYLCYKMSMIGDVYVDEAIPVPDIKSRYISAGWHWVLTKGSLPLLSVWLAGLPAP